MNIIFLCLYLIYISIIDAKSKNKCEVCVKLFENFYSIPGQDFSSKDIIKSNLEKFCESITDKKQHKICVNIGAIENSPTSLMGSTTGYLFGKYPPERICELLGALDMEICELKYDRPVDWNNLKSMRIKELRKILNDWNEACHACTEKIEFIKRIEELKPKYFKEL
ncbi:unnamed protein product [Gordionus sp. m RMFG-2023]|uniref:mesencephalic astrocyte-derived neurotrophic factor homolog n=1 Tax=Gordionus sp. m RMFG-2023 TaxID=3053472 RepID=UPI0030DEBA11